MYSFLQSILIYICSRKPSTTIPPSPFALPIKLRNVSPLMQLHEVHPKSGTTSPREGDLAILRTEDQGAQACGGCDRQQDAMAHEETAVLVFTCGPCMIEVELTNAYFNP